MITLSMPGAFDEGWLEGTGLVQGDELEYADRKLLFDIYRAAPRRRYGRRGHGLLLSFPETSLGLDALDILFNYAHTGVDACAEDGDDARSVAACRQMMDRTLAVIRDLENCLGVAPGEVTMWGIHR